MNVHERALILAATTIDFEIAPAERDELDRHLADCGGCRADAAGIRGDAEVIGGLPMLRHVRSHAAAPAVVGVASRTFRLVLVTALVALLAGLAVIAGAQFLQRWNNVVPPPISTSTAAPVTPTPVAPTSPLPTAPTIAWNVERVDVGTVDAGPLASGLAYANGRFVAVAGRDCDSPDATRCWGGVWTSADGLSWTKLERSSALAVSTALPTSGPEPGLLDVAGGPDGFVAIGYGFETRASIWHSPDGTGWTLTATLPGITRVRAVASTPAGWAVVGEVFEGLDDLEAGEPRAAIWTSPDGQAWTRAPDGPLFDVGGYFDTMEEPSSGGIKDIASDGTTVVAIGSSCDANGRSCVQAAWRSTDGLQWERLPDGSLGRLTGVSANAAGFTAVGMTCDTDTDPSSCDSVVVRSSAGDAWSEVHRAAYPVEYVGTAASDAFAIVLVKDEATAPRLLASADGLAWHELDQTLAAADLSLYGAGTTTGPNGSVVVLGWGSGDLGWESFAASIELAD